MSFEIIDFHTHPFLDDYSNICSHTEHCNMSVEGTRELFAQLGVSRICGSVLRRLGTRDPDMSNTDIMRMNNDIAISLRDTYGDFYIPGIHVHPDSVKESCDELERMHGKGVRLIGELVPYYDCWERYATKEIDEIADVARMLGMVVSIHPMEDGDTDDFVRRNPKLTIVAAHPGEYGTFIRHLDRMRECENYYLDTSGYGIFRHGMLRHAVDEFGAERFLFGSDYPTCNPAMYVGGVRDDTLLTDEEKRLILSENAKRLLGL